MGMLTPQPAFQGKVRDVYDLGDRLLFVATDRISAYDVILGEEIPHKGHVLTALSLYWFERTGHIVPNHFLSADDDLIDKALVELGFGPGDLSRPHEWFHGRSIIVRKADVVPIECVVRGYLAGSAWSEYSRQGTVCGQPLPAGLKESERLERPLFTPSTKATSGHDENITISEMRSLVGEELARQLQEISIAVYEFARNLAAVRGIIIADTKFEFGQAGGEVILVDEVLTPDSSRFWPAVSYEPGRSQPSFDKQFVRDWLDDAGWDRTPPAPELPADVVHKTSEKYLQAYELITGSRLEV
ncbi:MAG: phosphoribosylaminoimidazolesuccinocarboxamide synthase [Actinobacteria bacterium]|nr:MAG: phosphoribosylaminoimidazolesuccinocarboxamide synthase [Actinomycetota bacterium]